MEQDIDPRHLANLPDRAQVLAMMGEPSWYSDEEQALIYEYQLVGASPGEVTMRMVVWFDSAGIKPVRVETS